MKPVEAMFDGEVFRPSGSVELQPNTRVQLIVSIMPVEPGESSTFLQVAQSLHLKGPTDLAERLDDYLYGGAAGADE